MPRLVLSLISGMFAALAGVSGKFAFDDTLETFPQRTLAAICLLSCNGIMLHFFVQALRVDGSVVATTVNAAANIATSAFAGFLLLDEKRAVTPRWFLGATIALSGILCLAKGGGRDSQQKHHEE